MHVVVEEDLLANGAEKLKVAIESDKEVSRKLKDALKRFADMETLTKSLIKDKLSTGV